MTEAVILFGLAVLFIIFVFRVLKRRRRTAHILRTLKRQQDGTYTWTDRGGYSHYSRVHPLKKTSG